MTNTAIAAGIKRNKQQIKEISQWELRDKCKLYKLSNSNESPATATINLTLTANLTANTYYGPTTITTA